MGIQYVLCSKLRKFSYEEIEFFLPQICHLLISLDNESMALEEFIIDLCEESVNAALLVRLQSVPYSELPADHYRASGCSRPTYETSPAHPTPMRLRNAAEYTTGHSG